MRPLTVPGTLGSLASIRRYVALAATEAGLDEKTSYRLRLAVDEIATNIVVHGYAGRDEPGQIVVRAEAGPENLSLVLEDTGRVYDIRQTPPPHDLDVAPEQRALGGLGIYLALRSTDDYHYEQVGGRNRSTFLVRRNGASREDLARYERERQIAKEIQAGFLPGHLPQAAGWEIAARFEPAEDVAGDFYDAFSLSNNRRIALVIGDVCGKGIGAALFMALVRSLLRAFARQHYSLDLLDALVADDDGGVGRGKGRRLEAPSAGAMALKKAVGLTSEYILNNHGDQDMYATLFLGALDPVTGSLMYINAGHNPPYVHGPAGIRQTLSPTGPAVGILAGAPYRIGEVRLEPGETLLAYTDGVTEARNTAGEFFGDQRLRELLSRPAASADDLLRSIEDDVRAYLAGEHAYDDITMLAARRL